MMFLSNFANLFFYSKFFCFSVINYATKRGINLDPKWNKSSSSRPCFLHFYDLLLGFYKTGCHLKKKWHFQHWPTALDGFDRSAFEITIFDPRIQKWIWLQIIQFFFDISSKVFRFFWSFFIVVLYKSVTFNRLTDSCFFSLFTLRF